MIEVSSLIKRYGESVVLDRVSLTVPAGFITAVLGPNGAGKTTLIHCLSTLTLPDGGTATVAGHDVVAEPARVRASISMTGQFAALDDLLTGRENLTLFGRLLGLSRKAATARAGELLEGLRLREAADRAVSTYSGGMRRRLDLAVSLVVPRPVIFLDEPTTGLDPASRQDLWNMIHSLRTSGTSILLTTQYLEEADRLADEITLLDRGRVVAQGPLTELKARAGGSVCEIAITDPAVRARALDALGTASEHDGRILLHGADSATLISTLRRLTEAGISPDEATLRRPTLDEVYFMFTAAGGAAAKEPAS